MNNKIGLILIIIAIIIGIALIPFTLFNTLKRQSIFSKVILKIYADLIRRPSGRVKSVRIAAMVPAHCLVTSLAGNDITGGGLPSTTDTTPRFAGFANIRQANLTFNIDNGLVTGSSRANTQGYWSWSPSQTLSPETHSLSITAQHPDNNSINASCSLSFRVIASAAITSGGAGTSPPSKEAPAEKAPSTTTGTVTISPTTGGLTAVTNVDGGTAAVSFPPNTVSVSTKVIITPASKTTISSTHPFPSGLIVAGNWVYSFTAQVANKSTPQFKQAATLIFTYTDVQVRRFDESSLKVYYWNISNKEWIVLPDSTVNIATNTITATTTHFTLFAVMGSLISPAENPADLNGDKKVDLIDFGILLFNWGVPSNLKADINKDAAVDLVDFAIMLYWWTG